MVLALALVLGLAVLLLKHRVKKGKKAKVPDTAMVKAKQQGTTKKRKTADC